MTLGRLAPVYDVNVFILKSWHDKPKSHFYRCLFVTKTLKFHKRKLYIKLELKLHNALFFKGLCLSEADTPGCKPMAFHPLHWQTESRCLAHLKQSFCKAESPCEITFQIHQEQKLIESKQMAKLISFLKILQTLTGSMCLICFNKIISLLFSCMHVPEF